ncbi:hypothetical protein HDU97_004193 [Phlyctochytrium planicorne]|nr:hypothetical protein HDU97_004193 [Phlyctochytrium planicorne]
MSVDVPASCCTLAPVKQNYTPKGKVIKIGDMNVYLTGNKGAENAVVIHYDIFGDHENTRQVADILSTHGFRIGMPDLLRGNPWSTNKWPPETMQEVFDHIYGTAPYAKVQTDLSATVEFLKGEGLIGSTQTGCEKFGLVGFCWGGPNVGLISNTGLFSAAAVVHPAYFEPSDVENAKNPIIFFPAQDDKDFSAHVEILKKNAKFGSLVYQKRFDDVLHGFCSSRSNFNDELVGRRANECISLMHTYFTAALV